MYPVMNISETDLFYSKLQSKFAKLPLIKTVTDLKEEILKLTQKNKPKSNKLKEALSGYHIVLEYPSMYLSMSVNRRLAYGWACG